MTMPQQAYQTLQEFLEAAKRDEVFPRFYFDTNIILDLIEGRSQSSRLLFDFLVGKFDWRLYTAVFAQVEVYEKKQKDEFRRQKERAGWSNEEVLKAMDKRDLSQETLDDISGQVDAELIYIIEHLENITHLDDYGWDLAAEIKKLTNLSDHDAIHLAEALAVPCDVLLTRDEFFTDIAREYIWAVRPEDVIIALGIRRFS